MSVRNPVKAGKGSPIVRMAFIGDPGLTPVVVNPEPLKGSRRLKPDYEANKVKRSQQSYPSR